MQIVQEMYNKTVVEFGCVCVTCYSLWLLQITQSLAFITHDIMLNLIQKLLITTLTPKVLLLIELSGIVCYLTYPENTPSKLVSEDDQCQ